MQPNNDSQTQFSTNEALLSIALAIQNAFGSGALRLGKVSTNTTVTVSTSGGNIMSAIAFSLTSAKQVHIFVSVANLVGAATTDRVRFDVYDNGALIGRTYTGANNASGAILDIDVPLAAGSHSLQLYGIKDVGTGNASFYADASSTSYMVAEVVN